MPISTHKMFVVFTYKLKSYFWSWITPNPHMMLPLFATTFAVLRWGHPSLFHTAPSLLIWYKMFCVRDISCRLIYMEFIDMFSVYAQSGTYSRFNYANPVYGVAIICHQIRWLCWGHPSLFHITTSLLIWYKMFCVRDISYTVSCMKQIFFYSLITFSYTKCFVHSYTVDVVFTLSYTDLHGRNL